jgi:hypothetical protein
VNIVVRWLPYGCPRCDTSQSTLVDKGSEKRSTRPRNGLFQGWRSQGLRVDAEVVVGSANLHSPQKALYCRVHKTNLQSESLRRLACERPASGNLWNQGPNLGKVSTRFAKLYEAAM